MRQWTENDNAYLKQSAHKYSRYWLQSIFGISEQELNQKCSELGVEYSGMKRGRKEPEYIPEQDNISVKQINKKPKKWNPEKDKFLKENAADMTLSQLSEALKIGRVAIKKRCNRFNVPTRGKGRPKKTVEMVSKLKPPVSKESLSIAKKILSQYPDLLPGQIRIMQDICSYSPASAVRYCEAIQQYAENKAAYSPARIRNDR